MIALKTLTEKINNGLNALAVATGFPFSFAIQCEGGEYIPPKRVGNAVTVYINGITRIVDSDVIPVQGSSVSMVTLQLEITYPMPDDIQPENAIEPIRAILDAYFKQTFTQNIPDESGKEITVAAYATIPSTGSISLTTGPGLMCSFSCYVYYNFIENGVNSGDVTLMFDGVLVPYMDATITRVPVSASNPYSDTKGVCEAVTESTAINIEFTAPTMKSADNALFSAYKLFLLTGENPVHRVTVSYEGVEQTYSVIFGQSALSLEGVKNGNSRIALIEARAFENE